MMSEILQIVVVLLRVVVIFHPHGFARERVLRTREGRDTCGPTPAPVAPPKLHLWTEFSWFWSIVWSHLAILVWPVITGSDAGYPIGHFFHQWHFLSFLAVLLKFWLLSSWVVAPCNRAAVFALLGSPTARTPKTGRRAAAIHCTSPATLWWSSLSLNCYLWGPLYSTLQPPVLVQVYQQTSPWNCACTGVKSSWLKRVRIKLSLLVFLLLSSKLAGAAITLAFS